MIVGQKVMTILGAGTIVEIRHMEYGDRFLVELQSGGFGRGYSDVFDIDEITEIEE